MTDTQTILAPDEKIEVAEQATSIAVVVANTPVVVLLDEEKRSALYAHIEQEVAAFVPDLTTAKGRAEIKSLAWKITRTKTAIDDAGKKLNEDARAKINVVDAARRDSRNTLEMLAERVRKPLTDWEEAEKARVQECNDKIAWIKSAKNVFIEDTAETVRQRGTEVYGVELDAEKYGELFDQAKAVKDETIASLKASLDRLTREEAERAELERLRAAETERLEKEAAERAERERIAQEQEEARQAEERRKAAEQAEKERIAQAERDAAERARVEAQAKADAERLEQQRLADEERAEQQRKHDAELAEQRRLTAEAEQRERDRLAAEERAAFERAAREVDQAHRTARKTAAKEAIIALGIPDAKAVKLVQAIVAGDIPNVTLEF